MAPIFPEDRKRYPQLARGRRAPSTESDNESSDSETVSNVDDIPVMGAQGDNADDIPGLGAASTSRGREGADVIDNPDFRVTMSEVGFKRQNRFKYEDHQFR